MQVSKENPVSFKVVIPTRDSAQRVGLFLDAYRKLGVEPLYIVDSRSKDATLDALSKKSASLVLFTPSADFAEAGMIEFGSKAAGTPWVLRMDDDEFPSKSLLQWVPKAIQDTDRLAFEISRREVICHNGRYCYSRWPARWALAPYSIGNAQPRLHNVHNVTYIEKVHTTGFERPASIGSAPRDCLFVHCNNLLRSPSERLEKVRTYAKLDEGAAWLVADECLPELTDFALHAWASDGLEEFIDLFDKLPAPQDQTIPTLTDRERELMSSLQQQSLYKALEMRNAYETAMGLNSRWFPYIPRFLLKPLAKFLCSVDKRVDKGAVHETGVRMWNYYRHLEDGLISQN